MSLRARLGLGAAAGLLLVGLVPASVDAAPSAPARTGQDGPFLYSASFNVDISYGLRLDDGKQNIDVRKLTATVSGTLATVRLQDTYVLAPRAGKRSVRVERASAETTRTRNDGQAVEKCNGSTATPSGPGWIELQGGPWLAPFPGLKFPVTCDDSETGKGPGEFTLDRIVAYKWSTHGTPGADTIVYRVFGDANDPQGPFDCPGMVDGQTISCGYTIKGTVTLKRIKQAKPPKTASLSRGATKATAKTMCPMRCTIDITITTLDGRVKVTLVHLSPKPGRKTTKTIPIPARKRPAVKRSGGIRMKLDYKFRGGLKYSEVRRVRL